MKELWGSPGRWNVRKSYAEVARNLGVDEETVRNRLKLLKDSGLLIGWRVLPNPSLFGRSSIIQHLGFDTPAAKELAVSKSKQMDGVVVVASLHGNDLLITLFDDKERTASRRLSMLKPGRGPTERPGMGLPPTKFQMTPTDWRIVRLMMENAERSVAEVAAEVRVSVRTVKRRLDKMLAASAIFIVPMIDQAKTTGVSYQVMVESEEGQKPAVGKLVAAKIENLIFSAADSSNNLIFGFTGKNVSEGEELQDWLEKQPGVRSARVSIVDRVIYVSDWLEQAVTNPANHS
jgi:DNA-binding Lrp family transcriptional regulator